MEQNVGFAADQFDHSSKEEELAKQKALKADPELANGQDLTSSEDLTPVQTLTKRYMRQLERISRVKSDDVLDKTLNAMTLYL